MVIININICHINNIPRYGKIFDFLFYPFQVLFGKSQRIKIKYKLELLNVATPSQFRPSEGDLKNILKTIKQLANRINHKIITIDDYD